MLLTYTALLQESVGELNGNGRQQEETEVGKESNNGIGDDKERSSSTPTAGVKRKHDGEEEGEESAN